MLLIELLNFLMTLVDLFHAFFQLFLLSQLFGDLFIHIIYLILEFF
jgi:hypothetical protein